MTVSQDGATGEKVETNGLERVDTESSRAFYAIITAASILIEAKQKADESKFDEALELTRDSMRLASSAVLFRDGFVAVDLSSSIEYLTKNYKDQIPVEEWKSVETTFKSSIVDKIGAIFGLGNKAQLEKNVNLAIESADKFIGAAGEVLGPIPEELLRNESAEGNSEDEQPEDSEEKNSPSAEEAVGEAS